MTLRYLLDIAGQLAPERILFPAVADKAQALAALAQAAAPALNGLGADDLAAALLEREDILSTGVGLGIAVPHLKHPAVSGLVLALAVLPEAIPYDSLDDHPVNILVLILAPPDAHKEYLRALASFMLLLKNPANRVRLGQATTAVEAQRILKDMARKSRQEATPA